MRHHTFIVDITTPDKMEREVQNEIVSSLKDYLSSDGDSLNVVPIDRRLAIFALLSDRTER